MRSPLSLPDSEDSSGSKTDDGSGSPSSSSATTRARNRLETELQQRAALLAADNANMRAAVESANTEMHALKKRIQASPTINQLTGYITPKTAYSSDRQCPCKRYVL